MKIFLLLSIMPIVVSLLYYRGDINTDKKRSYCIICGAIIILVLGLRSQYMGSTDTHNYYNMMDQAIKASSWSDYYEEGVETGFQFLVFLLSRIFHHPQWIIFLSTLFYVSAVIIFCYKYSDNIRLSITMYICLEIMTFNMQGMRQSIAMSICLFAYMFIEKRKLLPFLVLIALAASIHKTAIVFVLVYPLSYLKIKPLYVFLVIISIAIVIYSSQNIIDIANNLWDKEYGIRVTSGGYIAATIYVLIFVFCVAFSKHPLEQNINSTMFYILIAGFICYIERYIGARASERISYYFIFSQLTLLPNALKNGRIAEKDKIAVEMVISFLCVLLFMYRLKDSGLIPFQFFWGDI